MGYRSSLDNKEAVTTPTATPAAMPAATPIVKLPTVAIGKQDLSFESLRIQDLDALEYVELLVTGRGLDPEDLTQRGLAE